MLRLLFLRLGALPADPGGEGHRRGGRLLRTLTYADDLTTNNLTANHSQSLLINSITTPSGTPDSRSPRTVMLWRAREGACVGLP